MVVVIAVVWLLMGMSGDGGVASLLIAVGVLWSVPGVSGNGGIAVTTGLALCIRVILYTPG